MTSTKEGQDVSTEVRSDATKGDGNKPAEFDDIMEVVGYRGRFQNRYNFVFNFVMVGFMAMPFLNLVLVMSIPEHHCHVPGRNITEYTIKEWHNKMLPREMDPKTNTESTSSCKMFINGTETGSCLHGYDYDTTWYTSTIPSKENWVCDNKLRVTNTFVAGRVGEIIGLFVFGQLGDRIGRKPVFYFSLTFLITGRLLMVFASYSYHLFLATVMLSGFAAVCSFQAPLVIGLEVTAHDKRASLAFIQCTGWVIGICATPLIMWVVGDWQTMIFVTTLPNTIAYLLFKMMPESPRWLASRGRVKDAVRSLKYIARVNGTKLPEYTNKVLEQLAEKKDKVYGIPSLFTSARLAKNTVFIVICWVICAVSYYALVLNITNMTGNPFMNFFWQSLVELPGYLVARFFSDRYGRRWTHTFSYLFVIIFCGAIIALHGSEAWVITLMVTLIRMSFTVAFYIVWLQGMEVYPTCVRQTGTSTGSLISNIFGMVGPYVVYLGTSVDARLPYVLLLVLSLLGIICSAMLPETLKKKLPETLEDAKDFGKDQKFWSLNL